MSLICMAFYMFQILLHLFSLHISLKQREDVSLQFFRLENLIVSSISQSVSVKEPKSGNKILDLKIFTMARSLKPSMFLM